MGVDKSAKAVTNRLRRASELRDLCLSLAKAVKALDRGSEPSEKAILNRGCTRIHTDKGKAQY